MGICCVCDSGNSNQGSVTTQRGGVWREVGGMFKWEGTWVNLWLIHVDVQYKPMQYFRAIILQLKINKILKKSVWELRPLALY